MPENTSLVDDYPLSPLQRGMLFNWLVDRHSGTDVEQVVGDLREQIDPARLEEAWQHAVDRFEALRTSFRWEGLETPIQRVEDAVRGRFTFEDLRHLSSEERDAAIEEFLQQDRRAGFDLTQAPGSRVHLVRLEDRHFRMIWTFHHILIDGRSFEIILNDVFGSYSGQPTPDFAERPYREYVDWVSSRDRSDAEVFWRSKLEGYTAPTPLPINDDKPSESQTFREVSTTLDEQLSRGLRELAAGEGVTVNTLLMAAWALLLSRYSGEDDVVFGVTKTTRRGTVPDAGSMVGLFLATVPMRVAVTPDRSVSDWLKAVREEWTSIRGSEYLPLVDIRSLTAVPSSEPLFRTLVVYENYQFGTRLRDQGGDWANRRFSIREQTGFPLTLLGYGDEGIVLKIEYETASVSASMAGRILGHLTTVLAAWVRDASGPVWATNVLPEKERETLLGEWQGPERSYPVQTPLAALVERQVIASPEAPAVTYEGTTISYAELNRRANQLARVLRTHGAGPDVLVGLSTERSIGMMVSLLAIIKAGAAYVPLDPTFPRDRLAYMIEDSGLSILITEKCVRTSLPPFVGVTLNLDEPTWTGEDDTDLGIEVDPECLAVVIYTSGSTGRPKGVEVPRRALVNLLWSMREWLDLRSDDRLLAVTTISFDIAGVDVWLPWLVGAHTVVAPREAAGDGSVLQSFLEDHDITFMQATPISWRQLLALDWRGKPDLQAVCTGEAMPPEVAQDLAPLVGRLWNLYGPSETTIWSTGLVVDSPEGRISIGRPIANTRCYILDDHLQPVPIGVVGELYIGGHGLARGYLNRPDLTEEKFRPDPFSSQEGSLMYGTGDLARHMPDGVIECLGRIDHQVKIRGFRIELGEIESVLQDHPGVTQAVLVAREETPGDRRLVGYFTATGEPPDSMVLREHLKEVLPEYMVPATFVCLERIPISANGKVDRKALPAPAATGPSTGSEVVRPRTHVEQQLTDIWEEAFGATGLSVTSDFFDLGGHSILAVQIMAAIGRVFGRKLPLNVLFEAPTIERLAAEIEEPIRTHGQHELVSIQAAGSRPPIFWIPGGAALGFFRFQHIVSELGSDQPVYGLGSRVPGGLDEVETVEERAKNYLELVRRVRQRGPYCFVGFCAGGLVALEMAQKMRESGEEVLLLGLINCPYPGFEARALRRAAIRAQRLRRQILEARSRGVGLVGYVRAKLADRRVARDERRRLSATKAEVAASGFSEHVDSHNDLLLEATSKVFAQYRPLYYPGRITLFTSEEEAYRGVSPSLDPRLAWRRHASGCQSLSFPGDHQGVAAPDAPSASDFAVVLKEAIDTATEPLGAEVALRPPQ